MPRYAHDEDEGARGCRGGFSGSVQGRTAGSFARPAALRRFPLTQKELAARFPKLADHLTILASYGCQDAAAAAPPSSVLDGAGTHHLVENQALVYRQAGDPLGRLAVTFDTTDQNEFAADPDTAYADLPNNANRTLLLRAAVPDSGANNRSIAGTASSAALARWGILVDATTGVLRVRASDGTNTQAVPTVGAYDDGLWHDVALVWDRTAGTPALRVITESEIASVNLGALSSADVATGLRLGACIGLSALAGTKISFAGFFSGAMTQADMAVWRTPL